MTTLRQLYRSGWGQTTSTVALQQQRRPRAESRSWVEQLRLLWLAGIFVLLPLDAFRLPLNITAVDIWMLMGLPVAWFVVPREARVISVGYWVAMWLILFASFVSTLVAPSARNGLVVIIKEVYILAWFATIAVVFAGLTARDLRRVLIVWSGMVFLHGMVLLGQFLSPAFWRFIVGMVGKLHDYEYYRPAGLFMNANSAAFFQLLGFVPLLLVSPSRVAGMVLGFLLTVTMLLTGSMGAALAFAAGCTVALAVVVLRGRLFLILKSMAQIGLVVLVVGGIGAYVVSHNERYQEHFAHIFLGRAERSSGGRFDLWQRGIDTFIEYDAYLWGIGPENFRVVDHQGKQLHNDVIAFTVERGLVATLGLFVFALVAMGRALRLVAVSDRTGDGRGLVTVAFVGAVVAAMVESLTHQTFHFREFWLVLALLEAMIFRLTRPGAAMDGEHRSLLERP